MNKYLRPLALALLVAAPVAATAQIHGGNEVRCTVESNAFNKFIAGKPTPVEFRAAYSCVGLVLPGDVTTMEMRTDNSRYFAQLDAHGRIVGGSFH
ncbi:MULTISPECIES: hypothetical protein [Luteibacter]|jgi:hypothetical protein|uniref:hypothetical protein n=1 Tax=Luteibacter sp. dw_328 TaxID=2719796 RepID=UPI0007BF6F3C|nr:MULTISPECIES: hypothetical protein [Luteibacter]